MGRGLGQRSRNAAIQPSWMRKVVEGSVLKNRNGTDYRIVRGVSRYSNGDLRSISLVIRRCSWTTRPQTTLNYHDILYRGLTLVEGVRVKLDKIWDENIRRSIQLNVPVNELPLRCWMVRGIP